MATRRKNAARSTKTVGISRWKLYLTMAVISIVVVAGFFLSGKQHFSSWDYSIRNSRLRKQIDELETEKRRLILAREVANSPNEVKRAAGKVLPATLASTAVLASATKPIVTTADKAIVAAAAKKDGDRGETYSIVKTAMVLPTNKFAKAEKPARTIGKNQAE